MEAVRSRTNLTPEQCIELGKLVAGLKDVDTVDIESHQTYRSPPFVIVEIKVKDAGKTGHYGADHVYLLDAGGGQHKLPTKER
jgi:hypothetical protein